MTNGEHVELTGKQLDVHRTSPGSVYSTDPGVCVTLCRSCHGPKPKRPRGTYPNGPVLFLRMPDYLEAALQAFIDAQLVPPDRTAVAVAALEGYFRKHGYLPPSATRKPSA